MESNAVLIRNYLTHNFITLGDLEKGSGLSSQQIWEFIDQRCAPYPSYRIRRHEEVYSNLSRKSELIHTTTEDYFSPSTMDWLREINHEEPSPQLSEQLYQNFKLKYEHAYIVRTGTAIHSETKIKEEWEHFLDGIYGICIKGSVTADSIVRKARAVEKVAALTDNGTAPTIRNSKRQELIAALREFDTIVSPFAPHDWPTSSRKRLFDDLIPRYNLYG